MPSWKLINVSLVRRSDYTQNFSQKLIFLGVVLLCCKVGLGVDEEHKSSHSTGCNSSDVEDRCRWRRGSSLRGRRWKWRRPHKRCRGPSRWKGNSKDCHVVFRVFNLVLIWYEAESEREEGGRKRERILRLLRAWLPYQWRGRRWQLRGGKWFFWGLRGPSQRT